MQPRDASRVVHAKASYQPVRFLLRHLTYDEIHTGYSVMIIRDSDIRITPMFSLNEYVARSSCRHDARANCLP